MSATPPDFRDMVASFPRAPGQVRTVEGREGVAEIIMDNPRKKNALTPHMMVELGDSAASAAERCCAVILRGEGGAFCSGGDLDAVRDHLGKSGSGRVLATHMANAIDTLESGSAVVLGVFDGPALGGGAELLMACDEIYASPSAVLGFVQVRLGVSPGFGGVGRAVNKLGFRRALSVLTEAKLLRAEELRSLNLVNHWSDDPLAAARSRAEELATLPRPPLRATVSVLRAHRPTNPDAREAEIAAFDSLWGAAAHRAALDQK